MIRGINRRIIEIKGGKDSPFDRAILFLKNDEMKTEGEIALISGELIGYREDGQRGRALKRQKLRLFLTGLLTGILAASAIFMLFRFLG